MKPSSTHGVTLIELLVVISIMVILAGAVVPMMRPMLEGRRIREAARAVNVYFGSARNRAMETGRPCGVRIQRFPGETTCSMLLEQVEVPPPYAGDFVDSRIEIDASGNVSFTQSESLDDLVNTRKLIRAGDLLQLNYQGHYWNIDSINTTTMTFSSYTTGADPVTPSGGLPFQIFRQPMLSAAAQLQLPVTTVIDLSCSGIDGASFGEHDDLIVIMFSPNGALDRVYSAVPAINGPAINPIFLLVGKREHVGTGAVMPNWRDLTNLWITLNPQTGLVTTAEVAAGANLSDSREFARQAQSMGGR